MAANKKVNFDLTAKDKTRPAFNSLNKSLKNTARTLQVVQGPLGPMAGRFTAFASALGSISPVALGSTAALTAMGLILVKSVKVAAEYERTLGTLEATLKATGGAAGLSTTEVEDFAIALGKATLTSREEVLRAATALSTFGSISEEVFTRTLELSQDAAQAFGQDLKNTVLQFGKALEDPITGLTSLRRIGVSFTSSQKDLIKSLVESGKHLEAQQLILAGIEKQVGGAGEGAAAGTAGAIDSLGEEFRQLSVEIGKSALNIGWFQAAIKNTAQGAGIFRRWLFGPGDQKELDAEIKDVGNQLIDATKRVRRAQLGVGVDPNPAGKATAEFKMAEAELAQLQSKLKILTDLNFQRMLEKEAADAAAEQVAAETAEEERLEALNAKRLITDKALLKLRERLFPLQAKAIQFQTDLNLLIKEYGAESEEVLRLQKEFAAATGGPNALKKTKENVEEIAGAANDMAGSFGEAFTAMTVEGAKFGETMKALLSDVAKQLVDVLITQQLVGAIASGISTNFPGFGAESSAIGGFRSGLTSVGEHGPELVNLPRGSKVIPNRFSQGGSGVVINNNVLPADQVQTNMQPDGTVIVDLIKNVVDETMNSNGNSGRNFQSNFGLRRQGVTR